MGAKFCENCGGKVDEGAKFCPACGKNVGSSSTPSDPMPTPTPMPMPVQQKNKKSKLKIVGWVIAAIILLMFAADLVGGGDSKSGGLSSNKTIQVKAEEIAKDYMADSDAAQKKYKDKDVEVTGKLVTKGQFTNSQNFGLLIYHHKENGKEYRVTLDLPTDEVETANKIKEGDFVKAQGTCVGTVDQKDDNIVSVQVHAKKVNQ
jgi:hypothetical protein